MTKPKQVEEEYGLGAVIPANETRDADGAALLAQEVIDTIRKPLLVLGDGMRVRSANRSYCNVFQALREDVEQSCFYDLDGGQWDTPRMRELLEHVWEHEAPFEDLELQSEFPRIGAKTVLVYARRLIHQGENSRLILLALEDITERRRAEQLLAAVDSYAQNIVDTVREPLLMLDPTLRVRSANRAFYQTFQVTPEETEGCLIYELGNRQWDIPGLRTLLEEIIPQKSVFNDYELAHDFPSIGRRVMLLNARELRAGNHTEVIVLALEDITERRRAEQVLAAVESYAQNIVDTVREPLLMLDPTLRVRSANRAFYQTFHVSAEETEGCLIYELGNRQWDIPGLRTLLEEIIPQKSVFNDYELAHDFPSIGRRVMLLNARELRAGNHTELIVLALKDITERRGAEEKIQVYMRKLEWSNRELQDFAYIASHDLQEPLRAIQAFGERLNKRVGEDIPEDARDSLERMLRAAARMRGLIRDLLEFSRVATKGRPFKPVDLGDAARQAWGDLSKRAEESGGSLELGALPTIEADHTQMRQLLQNLMDNALKYGRDGALPVVVVSGDLAPDTDAVETDVGRVMCRIEVRDNGIGFEEKYADRIFTPFQRLHGRGRYDGTGIGLAICRKIVERHGGRITAQSTPGVGSVFTILMPVNQSDGK